MADSMKTSFGHSVQMDERRKLTVTGVTDMGGFDEETVTAYTQCGMLSVKGSGLKVNRISVETGELLVEGEITALVYSDSRQSGGGFFSRMFR